MALPTVNQNVFGSFVPTMFILDVARIQEVDVNSDEFKELLVRLYQNLNSIVLSLNLKTTGVYTLNQFVTGGTYYPSTPSSSLVQTYTRPITRVVINFGALPNTSTKSVPHNINFTANTTVTFVQIYGTATDPSGLLAIPLPYSSITAVTDNVELYVTTTDVIVKTGSNRSAYTTTYIVLEFLTQP